MQRHIQAAVGGTRWLPQSKINAISAWLLNFVVHLMNNKYVGMGHPARMRGSGLPALDPCCSSRNIPQFVADCHRHHQTSFSTIPILYLFLFSSTAFKHHFPCHLTSGFPPSLDSHHVLHPQIQRPSATKPRTSSSTRPSKHHQQRSIRSYHLTNASTNRRPNHQPYHGAPLERAG